MITLLVVKQTRKEHDCVICGKAIPKGSACLTGHGTDHDEMWVNDHIHGYPEKCFIEYLEMMDMIDACDIEDYANQLKSATLPLIRNVQENEA